MLLPLIVTCPHCWQEYETSADPSQGNEQSYVEDCQVCCRPLLLKVHVENGEAWGTAEPESD